TSKINECSVWFSKNIEKGIETGLYRKDLDISVYVRFYYILIFTINESISSEKEAQKLELEALEYHTRAMATKEGTIELEKQLEIAKLNY
ncbi:MAG: hypothetical protein QG594_2177, partial [Bacteroidota bacterium]|nr:hypothetical protein [Bacteroidota bacterium]